MELGKLIIGINRLGKLTPNFAEDIIIISETEKQIRNI